jgi:hypothetical protein
MSWRERSLVPIASRGASLPRAIYKREKAPSRVSETA